MNLTKNHLRTILLVFVVATFTLAGFVNFADQRININQIDDAALSRELDKVSEIGPVLTKRCVEYRQLNGNIKVVDLIEVKGVGPKRVTEIKKKFKD